MERDFITRLKWCRREVEALKTAQNVGLGLVDFYSDTEHYTYNPTTLEDSNLMITVQFSSSLDFRPYCECYLDNGGGDISLGETTFDDDNKQIKFRYLPDSLGVTYNLYFKIISVAPIVSVSIGPISP